MDYDVFVCHASEDKGFVEPLAQALKDKRLAVWYAPFELKIGDSLRQEIDRGLANSRYGIVVLSKSFFQKKWPQNELDALASRQNAEGRKVILPIWHGIEAELVRKNSPLLESLLAARSRDGLESVVSQILSVCSEPVEVQSRSVFPSTGNIGLRERCLDVIRRGGQTEWVKLVDELQSPIEERLIAWKPDAEAAIQEDSHAWREALLKAANICVPGFLPLFTAVEAGQKEHWKDAVRILHRLALFEKKMGGGITDVLRIGLDILYVPGSIGMAIAVETGRNDFIWDWMRLPMPGYRQGMQTPWADIRAVFWPPVGSDFKDPFRFLLDLCHSEHMQGFFPSEDRMKEFLLKANLLQSMVELRLLTRTKEGAAVVEARDKSHKVEIKVEPLWCLTKPEDFDTWTWDLFGSSEGFLEFFMMDTGGHIPPEKIWDWWKGWKVICKACLDAVTSHRVFLRTEWLMLPGEPDG